MSLLMPDINLRRAKHHLERYWRQLLGAGEQNGERKRLKFRSKSVAGSKSPQTANPVAKRTDSAKVAPPIQNLEHDPKTEAATGGNEDIVGDCHEKPNAQLDCGSSSVVKSNQDTDDEEQNEELDAVVGNKSTAAKSEEVSQQDLKPETEQAPSSTSTTETSSSVSSAVTLSSRSTAVCVGKPPLSRVGPQLSHDNRSSYSSLLKMPQPTYISRVKGPTLGSILQQIHLNDGNVSELDFSSLAQRNKRLESEGCDLVARSLSTNHTVRKLIIRDHAIGDDGAAALSKMLCNNTTLECLKLFGNAIGDRGAEALAQALYGHDSLTHLSLRNNRISDRGATALAQAIRCNCTLKSLELANNRITRVGAQALLDALDVNFYLETIGLDENNVPAFVESQLAAAFARNRAQALILESHAAEKKAVKIVRRASGYDTQGEDEDSSEVDEEEWEGWEDDDGESVSSGFLSCSNVTDIPLSSSGLWI